MKHFIADDLVSGTEEEKRLKKAIKDYSKSKLEQSKNRGNSDNNKKSQPYSSLTFTPNQNDMHNENSKGFFVSKTRENTFLTNFSSKI